MRVPWSSPVRSLKRAPVRLRETACSAGRANRADRTWFFGNRLEEADELLFFALELSAERDLPPDNLQARADVALHLRGGERLRELRRCRQVVAQPNRLLRRRLRRAERRNLDLREVDDVTVVT